MSAIGLSVSAGRSGLQLLSSRHQAPGPCLRGRAIPAAPRPAAAFPRPRRAGGGGGDGGPPVQPQRGAGRLLLQHRPQALPLAELAALAMSAPAAGAGGGAIVSQFTPVTALLGGVVLGVAALGKLALTGRILGISGALKGFVQGGVAAWRVAFVAGLALGAAVAAAITPAAFDALPATFTTGRAALAGLLVGLGAALGNGCTSGHGICGNARLSLRSAAFTVVSMAAGVAAATLAGSAAAIGLSPAHAALALPDSQVWNSGMLLLATALLSMLGLARAAGGVQQQAPSGAKGLALASELAAGCLFAFGLTYAGMVRPSKVIGFLSPAHPAWDPTLALVMAGALGVALPGFQALLSRGVLQRPYCEAAFQLPPARAVDARLLLGAAVFGAGWGLGGMCPGPAVVAAVARPSAQAAAFVAAMLAGLWAEGLAAARRPSPPAAPRGSASG